MNVSNGKTRRGQLVELLGNNKNDNNDDDDDDVELNYEKILIIGISVESF